MVKLLKKLICFHSFYNDWYFNPILNYEESSYFGNITLTCNNCNKIKEFEKRNLPIGINLNNIF